MVMTGATTSRSPIQTTPTATAPVTRTAARGSVALPIWAAIQRGVTSSRETAWSVRGAASTLPRADESVDAATPARIRTGTLAIAPIAFVFVVSSSAVRWMANHTAAAT